jgi:hypothetical protein
MNVKEIVMDNTVKFSYYRDGMLWYDVVDHNTTDVRWTFPVNILDTNDIGMATFPAELKAITLMRYIRKAIDAKTIFEHKGI